MFHIHMSQVSQMITARVRTMPSPTGAAASGTITLDQGRNLSSASINLEITLIIDCTHN